MTIEDIIKSNGGHVSGQTTAQSSASSPKKDTNAIDEIIAQGKAAADKQLSEQRHTTTNHAETSKPTETSKPSKPANIKAFGAYGSNGKQETTSRVGKTVNAGVQGTMSNFTNLFGWLKEADAMAAARDEADKAYTAQQNKELVEGKGEKATAKTSAEQKKTYNEAHAKQKDTWSEYYKKADELSAMSEKNTAEAKKGLGAVGQALVDLGVVGTQMLGDAAANLIIPGGGAASMVARVAGGGAQQARLEGKDIGDQSKAAVKSGAISYLTEKMFGAFGKLYGKGAADDIVEKVVGKIGKSNAGRNALRVLLNSVGEGVEEMTEDLLNAAADKVLKLGDGKVDVGKVLYDGLLGFMMGGFGGVPQIFNGNYSAKNEALQIAGMQKVFAKTVAENAPDAETAQAAQAMVEKIENGGSLAAEEVATLVEAMDAIDDASQNATAEQAEEKPLTPVEAVVKAAKGEVGATQENAAADPTIAQEATTAIEQAQEAPVQKSDYVPKAIKNAPKYQNANPYTGNAAIANKLPSKIATILKRARQVVVSRAKINGAEVNFVTDGHLVYFVDDNVAEQAISSYGNTPSPNLSGIVEGIANAKDTTLLSKAPVVIKPDDSKMQIAVFKIDGNYSAYDVKFLKALDGGRLYIAKGEKWDTLIATDKDGNISGFALPVKMTDELIAKVDVAFSDREQSNLPEGMGAASADFTGEMTPAEQWVAEAQGKGDNALHPISDEQQQNLAEQQGRAPQEMPKVDLNGMLTSKTANTAQNSGVTTADMSNAILNDAANGRFSYYEYSDKAALEEANQTVETEGWDRSLVKFKSEVDRGKVSKKTTVLGITLYNQAVTKGDYVTAMDVLDGLVKTSRDAAQAMQAVRILNRLSPDSRLYAVCRSLDSINAEVRKKYGDKALDIAVDETLFNDYVKALQSGDEAATEKAWEAVQQNIADQIPASWSDKLNAWRYLAMLGNTRTHIRNIVGNAFFMPVVFTKNAISAGIETVVDKVSKNGIDRTKVMLNPFFGEDKTLYQTAALDYSNVKSQILSGGKFEDIFSGVSDKQTIFRSKLLENFRKANRKALDVEDEWFARPHYAMALASYLKANGITAAEFTNGGISEETAIEARNYAIKEAQKATYRDINAFSEAVSNIGKTKSKAVNIAASAVLPFKKTPANILARAVEYSPAGLVKGLADLRHIKSGKMSVSEVIDEMSAGLTGTGLVALGYLLTEMGVLYGGSSDDEKENKFFELQGKQNYALVLPDGTTVTLDWLAPEVLPIFIGAEIFNARQSNGESVGSGLENIFSAIMTIPQPMLDMSMLQSVNDLIDSASYAKEGRGIYKVLATVATSLLSQFAPTVFGQIERIIETERQQTYIDHSEGAPSSSVQAFWGRLNNKNPLYDYNQIPYIDAWGRIEETGNVLERGFNNLFNPAYVKNGKETPIDDELKRLYELGNDGVYPTKPGMNTKVNGNYLTADQYVEYAKKRGSLSLDTATKVIRNPAYHSMTDEQKAKAIEYAYSYANYKAKLSIDPNTKTPKWVKGSSPLDYIMEHAKD